MQSYCTESEFSRYYDGSRVSCFETLNQISESLADTSAVMYHAEKEVLS